jgi:phage tail sheath protein FI
VKADGFTYEQPPAAAVPLPTIEELDKETLFRVHEFLINFCEARADALAVLSLPLDFEKRQCIEWLETLRQNLGLPKRGRVFDDVRDMADLSYAAVYHPWLLVADPNAPHGLRATPPDGAVCGMIAAREQERQAWIAPANLPLQGALALALDISDDDWAELFDLQFNLIRREPRDFRAMSAHTLSGQRDLLQVSVRRLMILLRKAAIERGMNYVFRNNSEHFREAVRVSLEEMLRFMFERGAFAGATADEAFRVTTGASVNTPQSIDQGRFIALIQVAPSEPMEFITVLLIRTGDNLLQAMEV